MKTFAVFGVGLGNLGKSRRSRIDTTSWVAQLNSSLSAAKHSSSVLTAYGHTGNFVVRSPATADVVATELAEVLATPCAVLEVSDLVHVTESLRDLSIDTAPSGIRYTPGAALLVSGESQVSLPGHSPRATYVRRTARVVLLCKRDVVTTEGILDRNRRMGGWGAIAAEVGRTLGGQWTARSHRTLSGTLRAAALQAKTDYHAV